MLRRGRRVVVAALAALALLAAACGGDDDDTADVPVDAPGDSADDDVEGSSTVSIQMVDFGYTVSGPLATGVQTFETTNNGDEIHMMGIGKLRDGVTLDDVVAVLSESGGEGEEGDEGEEGGDPFEELFEGETGTPGHILLPGESQRITLDDDLDVGAYALICFLPGEGDGVPHFAKGMVNELQVVPDGGDAEFPEPDAEYTLTDGNAADGPDTLAAGEVTLRFSNDGDVGKDVFVAQLGEGETLASFDEFFVTMFEGEEPPPVGAASEAPGRIAASTFEIPPGNTIFITVELSAGSWTLVSTDNVDEEAEDHILELTVT